MTSQGVFSPDGLGGSVPLAEIERTLGAGLKDLASELRLIDATDFAAFIRIGHMANLRSLVQSSAELHFKPGTLELAELGEIELGWFKPPLITLPNKRTISEKVRVTSETMFSGNMISLGFAKLVRWPRNPRARTPK